MRENHEAEWSSMLRMHLNEKQKGQKSASKTFVIADIIDYQMAAVVSKTLLDKTAGNVTVFAFDKGQGLSEHTAPFDALIHLLDGRAELTISGKSFQLKKGEVAILPANRPHSLKAIERFKMILTMIHS